MNEQLNEAFLRITELHTALDLKGIADMPGGYWLHIVDDKWIIAVNANKNKVAIKPDKCLEIELEPFHAAIWYNGWIAGIMTPFEGVMAAGEGANENTFIAAMDLAIESVKTTSPQLRMPL